MREGIKHILTKASGIQVAGEADSSRRAQQMARQENWDLVLMDIDLPDRMAFETLDLLKKEHPDLKILMLSMQRESHYAVRALNPVRQATSTSDARRSN